MLLDKLYKKLDELDLDGILIFNQHNIAYLTNFFSRDSYLLLSKYFPSSGKNANGNAKAKKINFFITDFRYLYEAKKNLKGFFIEMVNGSVFRLIGSLTGRLNLKRLGFEAKHSYFAEYEEFKKELPYNSEFVPTYDLVESFRQIKSKNELSKIKKAIEITKLAFQYAKTIIRVGVRENELACLLESFIKERGADSFSFDIIVASGQNTSYPHYKTSKKRLKKGEVLLIDMGVNYLGYKSDLTRIFFLDKITPVIRRIYNIVLMAQERAIKNIKPGVPISEIDRTARQFITRQGFGRYFGHSLGHGIGLEVHEDPHISFKNNNLLTENMIFTVEPAIYLPGRLGIRIEDMVLVTPNGAEILSGDIDKSI